MSLFTCEFCRAPVRPGKRFCKRQRCINAEIQRQSVLKCEELGIPFNPALFKPFAGAP